MRSARAEAADGENEFLPPDQERVNRHAPDAARIDRDGDLAGEERRVCGNLFAEIERAVVRDEFTVRRRQDDQLEFSALALRTKQ